MVQDVFTINGNIKESEPIVIFGTGVNGKRAYFTFLNMGVKVYAFADRDNGVVGKKIFGKLIISEKNLIGKNYTVVIASQYWEDIKKRLESEGIKNIYVMNMYGEHDKGIII